jgi:hypothetical protein
MFGALCHLCGIKITNATLLVPLVALLLLLVVVLRLVVALLLVPLVVVH